MRNFHVHEWDQPDQRVEPINQALIDHTADHKVDRTGSDTLQRFPDFLDVIDSGVELVLQVQDGFTNFLEGRLENFFPHQLHATHNVVPFFTNPREDWLKNVLPQPGNHRYNGVPGWFQDVLPNPLHRRHELVPPLTDIRENR